MAENSLKSNTNQISNLNDKRILFVDSSKRIRDALSLFFEFEDCDFLAVGTPEEAIKVLQNDPYDIIIADYYLPGPNGMVFLNHIKSNFSKTMKILTAFHFDRNLVEAAKEAGIKDVIQKPFSAETLLLHLSQIFEEELKNERHHIEQ